MVDWSQIGAIAAVLSLIVVILKSFKREGRFKLSVDPEEGHAMLGGVIQTVISVNGGYKNFVRLSIPDHPPGLAVTFTPEKVIPRSWTRWYSKSSHKSTMTINVRATVPGEVYPIDVVGAGAQGNMSDTCTYYLTCLNPR